MKRVPLLVWVVVAWMGFAVGCALPVAPPAPGPGPTPWSPVDPPQPQPPPPAGDGRGEITEAQLATVANGESEKAITDRLGAPFMRRTPAGFVILTYVLPTRTAFLWLKADALDHVGFDR